MTAPGADHPTFSVVTPVYDPPTDVLAAMIESVLAQSVADWELILVDDCSTDPAVRPLLRSYAARDARIRVVERATNGHIVAASNDGVDLARGEFVVLVDHDDLLTPHALRDNARVVAAHDDVDYVYSDEDKIDGTGRLHSAFRKPDWSPELLRGMHYCSHLSVLRTSLVREVGGFRTGFEGSQDHDLVLRVTERARRIVHVPEVLYHWRAIAGSAADDINAKPYATEAGRRAVQEHLDRTGVEGTAAAIGPSRYVVERALPTGRRVSIVIPTRGSSGLVWGRSRVLVVEAVRAALLHTAHEDLEVVVVVDDPTPAAVLDQLRELVGDRLVVVPFHEEFNYSRKVNLGVLASTGDRIVILNDDTEARSPEWLGELLAPLEEPDVGMTGAKLFFSSNTIQHAGLAMTNGEYCHAFVGLPADHQGYFGALQVNREVSGVTGACVGIRREVFLEVGGLTELLPHAFNDVDFSYKVRAAGYRILFTYRSELFHFESMTRTGSLQQWEYDVVRTRWGRPTRDPYLPVYPDQPPSPAEVRAGRDRRRT